MPVSETPARRRNSPAEPPQFLDYVSCCLQVVWMIPEDLRRELAGLYLKARL